jgi:hypothetical protein
MSKIENIIQIPQNCKIMCQIQKSFEGRKSRHARKKGGGIERCVKQWSIDAPKNTVSSLFSRDYSYYNYVESN